MLRRIDLQHQVVNRQRFLDAADQAVGHFPFKLPQPAFLVAVSQLVTDVATGFISVLRISAFVLVCAVCQPRRDARDGGFPFFATERGVVFSLAFIPETVGTGVVRKGVEDAVMFGTAVGVAFI
jgi:hypothetical protein